MLAESKAALPESCFESYVYIPVIRPLLTLFTRHAAVKQCCVSGKLHYVQPLAKQSHVNCNDTPMPGGRMQCC